MIVGGEEDECEDIQRREAELAELYDQLDQVEGGALALRRKLERAVQSVDAPKDYVRLKEIAGKVAQFDGLVDYLFRTMGPGEHYGLARYSHGDEGYNLLVNLIAEIEEVLDKPLLECGKLQSYPAFAELFNWMEEITGNEKSKELLPKPALATD